MTTSTSTTSSTSNKTPSTSSSSNTNKSSSSSSKTPSTSSSSNTNKSSSTANNANNATTTPKSTSSNTSTNNISTPDTTINFDVVVTPDMIKKFLQNSTNNDFIKSSAVLSNIKVDNITTNDLQNFQVVLLDYYYQKGQSGSSRTKNKSQLFQYVMKVFKKNKIIENRYILLLFIVYKKIKKKEIEKVYSLLKKREFVNKETLLLKNPIRQKLKEYMNSKIKQYKLSNVTKHITIKYKTHKFKLNSRKDTDIMNKIIKKLL